MERLKQENCRVPFKTASDMKNFLSEMEKADIYIPFRLNSIQTMMEEGDPVIKGLDPSTGMTVRIPLWPWAIKSLEKRSGDNATGHSLMDLEQVLNSMNNYWGLYSEKKECVARVRGERLMGLGSEQYEVISQLELLEKTERFLESRHAGGYSFSGGEYTHGMTVASFEVTDSISPTYVSAWRSAGLPEPLLKNSSILVDVFTNDCADCSAKAIVRLNVGGSKFLIGNPIVVEHRNGRGGIEAFEKELAKLDLAISDELDALSDLMSITLIHPKEAAITALKKAKIDRLSKKACKELVDDMLFSNSENAYVVYLYLHGILDTFNGNKLNEERKFRVTTALRTLLKEDWRKMDVPSASL